MTRFRLVGRRVVALALAAFAVAGCASSYTSETMIGGRPVAYRSAVDKGLAVNVVNQDVATYEVGRFKFTVEPTRVSWGSGQSLALPSDWKRVDLIDKDTHIEVRVNGKPVGEIPATAPTTPAA